MPNMRKKEREHYERMLEELRKKVPTAPVPMVLYCPAGHQHIDKDGWDKRPHKTHLCTEIVDHKAVGQGFATEPIRCGLEWKPALFATVGVAKL